MDADGGRLKLEWRTLRGRSGDRVEDLLWWEGEDLLGFLGLYSFGSSLELAGMVAPAARRRGIATTLLDAALHLGRDQGYQQALLVVPRTSVAGQAFAVHRRGALEHSEHALALVADPTAGFSDPRIILRRAVAADAAAVSRLLQVGFGDPPRDLADQLASEHEQTLLVEMDNSAIATLRVAREDDGARVYGFVVDPAWQRRGIGRDVLRRVCKQLRAEGIQRIGLEVSVDNDRALGLYTSVGFTEVTTEDYYVLRTR